MASDLKSGLLPETTRQNREPVCTTAVNNKRNKSILVVTTLFLGCFLPWAMYVNPSLLSRASVRNKHRMANTKLAMMTGLETNFSSLPENSFFFIDTIGQSATSDLVFCVLESAARSYPDLNVILLSVAENREWTVNKRFLDEINVQIAVVDQMDIVSGMDAEFQSWFKTGYSSESKYNYAHLADVLRNVVVYLKGGIYMDSDVITFKPLDKTRNNSIIFESGGYVTPSVMKNIPKGSSFLRSVLDYTPSTYDANAWSKVGLQLSTKVMKEVCHSDMKMFWPGVTCGGNYLYPEQSFHLLNWRRARILSNEYSNEDNTIEIEDFMDMLKKGINDGVVYGLHMYRNTWGRKGTNFNFQHLHQLVEDHFRDYCPRTFIYSSLNAIY
jgi:hypothetical protein